MPTIRRTIAAAVVAVAVLAGVAVASPAQAATSSQRNAAFAAIVKPSLAPGQHLRDARVVAKAFCHELRGGAEFEDTAMDYLGMADDNGVSADTLGTIIGGGVAAYCPKFKPELRQFVRDYGSQQ